MYCFIVLILINNKLIIMIVINKVTENLCIIDELGKNFDFELKKHSL